MCKIDHGQDNWTIVLYCLIQFLFETKNFAHVKKCVLLNHFYFPGSWMTFYSNFTTAAKDFTACIWTLKYFYQSQDTKYLKSLYFFESKLYGTNYYQLRLPFIIHPLLRRTINLFLNCFLLSLAYQEVAEKYGWRIHKAGLIYSWK